MSKVKSYKVWVHIEGLDKHGDCIEGDDYHEPREAGEFDTPEAAEAHRDALLDGDDPVKREMAEALRNAVERMEAVAEGIHVEKRSKGISQAKHVRHMAGHLAQHAKLARAALEKAGVS